MLQLLPGRQSSKPTGLVAVGSKHSGWSIFIGFSLAAGTPGQQQHPELLRFLASVKLPGGIPPPPPPPPPTLPPPPPTPPPPSPISSPFPPPLPPRVSYPDLLEPLGTCQTPTHTPQYTAWGPSVPPQGCHCSLVSQRSATASSFSSSSADDQQPVDPQAAASVAEAASAPAMISKSVTLSQPAHQLCLSGPCHSLTSRCSALGFEYQLVTQVGTGVTATPGWCNQHCILLKMTCTTVSFPKEESACCLLLLVAVNPLQEAAALCIGICCGQQFRVSGRM